MFIVMDSREIGFLFFVVVCLFVPSAACRLAHTQRFSGFEKCLVEVWSQLGFSTNKGPV